MTARLHCQYQVGRLRGLSQAVHPAACSQVPAPLRPEDAHLCPRAGRVPGRPATPGGAPPAELRCPPHPHGAARGTGRAPSNRGWPVPMPRADPLVAHTASSQSWCGFVCPRLQSSGTYDLKEPYYRQLTSGWWQNQQQQQGAGASAWPTL